MANRKQCIRLRFGKTRKRQVAFSRRLKTRIKYGVVLCDRGGMVLWVKGDVARKEKAVAGSLEKAIVRFKPTAQAE